MAIDLPRASKPSTSRSDSHAQMSHWLCLDANPGAIRQWQKVSDPAMVAMASRHGGFHGD